MNRFLTEIVHNAVFSSGVSEAHFRKHISKCLHYLLIVDSTISKKSLIFTEPFLHQLTHVLDISLQCKCFQTVIANISLQHRLKSGKFISKTFVLRKSC